jgi:hypothetical protein
MRRSFPFFDHRTLADVQRTDELSQKSARGEQLTVMERRQLDILLPRVVPQPEPNSPEVA